VKTNRVTVTGIGGASSYDELIYKFITMKPLVVLIAVFILSLLLSSLIAGEADEMLSGRIAMSAMLLLTAIGHFKFKKGMALMLPAFIPAKEFIVFITGVLEILAAIGLLVPATVRITAICLIVFFLFVLPANIYASMNNINYETGEYDGNGMKYLWFRVPLQALFILWVYWFALE
jgi:uncharacterized membrane protein